MPHFAVYRLLASIKLQGKAKRSVTFFTTECILKALPKKLCKATKGTYKIIQYSLGMKIFFILECVRVIWQAVVS